MTKAKNRKGGRFYETKPNPNKEKVSFPKPHKVEKKGPPAGGGGRGGGGHGGGHGGGGGQGGGGQGGGAEGGEKGLARFLKPRAPSGSAPSAKKGPRKVGGDIVVARAKKGTGFGDSAVKAAKKVKEARGRDTAAIVNEAKAIWEKARVKHIGAEDRKPHLDNLMELIRGRAHAVCVKHDSSRVVQCVLKYGTSAQRQELIDELAPHLVDLSKKSYAKFLVCRMFYYGVKEQKARLLKTLLTDLRRLLKNKDGSKVVEYVFSEIADDAGKRSMMHELYGPTFAFGRAGLKESQSKVTLPMALEQFKKEGQHASADQVVRFISELLQKLYERTFNLYGLSVVHQLTRDWLEVAPLASARNYFDGFTEHALDLMHTKAGAEVLVYTLAHGTAKDRKKAVKSLKGFVKTVAFHEWGSKVILSMFSRIDDTKTVTSIITEELCTAPILDVLSDKAGHAARCLLFLLNPNSNFYVPEPTRRFLVPVGPEPVAADSSKKDPELRRSELLAQIMPSLTEACAENVAEIATSSYGNLVFMEAARSNEAFRTAVIPALVKALTQSSNVEDSKKGSKKSGKKDSKKDSKKDKKSGKKSSKKDSSDSSSSDSSDSSDSSSDSSSSGSSSGSKVETGNGGHLLASPSADRMIKTLIKECPGVAEAVLAGTSADFLTHWAIQGSFAILALLEHQATSSATLEALKPVEDAILANAASKKCCELIASHLGVSSSLSKPKKPAAKTPAKAAPADKGKAKSTAEASAAKPSPRVTRGKSAAKK